MSPKSHALLSTIVKIERGMTAQRYVTRLAVLACLFLPTTAAATQIRIVKRDASGWPTERADARRDRSLRSNLSDMDRR